MNTRHSRVIHHEPRRAGKRGGSIRLHGNLRKLARRITKGTARIQSVTISRGGKHWHASVLAKETITVPDKPTRAQAAAGPVGVDVGVHHYAALSTGETIANPRHLRQATQRLVKAQRALARTGWWLLDADGETIGYSRKTPRRGVRKKPTTGRLKAQARVARLHAELAERRETTRHLLTKQLATRHDVIAIEDLNVAGMTASAKGTLEEPGRNVAAKSGLNRSVLDVGFGEIRRQLAYKTTWYGSRMVLADRYAPTSKTCSTCGTAKAKLPLAERTYHCTSCGMVMDRDVNAARNILTTGVMHDDAYGKWESRNADRAEPVDTSAAPASTSEGQDREGGLVAPAEQSAGRPSGRSGQDCQEAAPATPVEESTGHPHIHTEYGAA